MNALFRLRWLLAGLFWVSTLPAARASHILGGDITYAPVAATTVGVPRYHVVVRLFRDVTGVDQPTVRLACNRSDCNATASNYFFVDNILRTMNARRTSLGCATASPFRVYDTYLYETDVDLPPGQWTLSASLENRSGSILNIPNSIARSFYISAFLDNQLAPQNSSPQFLTTLLPYLCGSTTQRYSFSSFDSDGDSLAYSFILSQENLIPGGTKNLCGSPIAGSFSPHFQINAATGELTAPAGPVQQGTYVMAARVNEYRRIGGTWQPIGYIIRDVSYLAYSGTNLPPGFTGLTLASGATQPLDQLIAVRPGQTVSLLLTAADPDAGQTLRFSSEATNIIPGLSLATVSGTQARLTWQVPASLPPGRYRATIAVQDDGCPLNASAEQTVSFVVSNLPLATRATSDTEATAFPMPFREQVQFRAGGSGQLVVIVDELGRTIAQLRAGADGRVLWQPAASLPAGLYLARGADGRPLARLLHAAN
ncbi:hypothetical protein [Hymenobacter cheonanensis]|uniref:hypothetical protein n=1 Tax=Hymenobacter sp. CA2-7 TaxID=3063993 RepID=UPI002712D5DE|nr:hypothetical protein [Hymenobacter sp. CA2-7]MDO7885388.1 hypothetical protein [Hymenobacter sp. CA2-7]